MDKTLVFKWISLVENGESSTSGYQERTLFLSYAYTKVSLLPTAELAKQVERFEGISLTSGPDDNRIFIDGLTTPIRLTERGNAGHLYEETILTGNGPSLKWLLENMVQIENPNPDKVFYVGSIAIQVLIKKYSKDVHLLVLDVKVIEHSIYRLKSSYEKPLKGTFDELLESYGYTNTETIENASYILTVFQKAKELEFRDPKEIVEHFCDRRLVAELTLKGVFDKLLEN